MPLLRYLLLCLVLFFGSICSAQKYNFKNFSVNEGLTQSEIYSICEDRRGSLWFATAGGGIIRFDGYNFVSFRQEDGLVNDFVRVITEDRKGNLWIGTEKGVCIYDGRSFKVLDQPTGPGKRVIKTILEDRDQNIWIGTENGGLYKFRNNRFEKFSSSGGLPDNTINCVFLSEENELWIGTNKGASRYKNRRFENFNEADGLVPGNIRSISQDKRGNMWFASHTSGVSRFAGGVFTTFTETSGLASNRVFSVYSDKKGTIWFGTANGLSKWDGRSFRNFTENNGLGSSVILCIAEDATSDIWLGTSGGGVSRLDNARFMHLTENEKMGRQVFSLVQAANGKMLFATSAGGLTLFDGANYSLLKGTDDFTSSRVKSLYNDRYGNLWIGTLSDGTYKFNDDGFQRIHVIDSLIGKSINSFALDTAGNMWFGSPDSGICVITHKGTAKSFGQMNGLISNNIYALLADKLGNVWVGSDKGLNRISVYDPDSALVELSSFGIKNGLSNTAIRCIAADETGNIYVGSAGGGIFVLKDAHFINIERKSGLTSNNIYALVFDNRKRLWSGTEQGVDCITFDDKIHVTECRHFGKTDGFTGLEVFRNASYRDKEGKIWFGTVNGATVYDPSEDHPYKEPPVTHLTGIKLFYDNIEKTQYVDNVSAWYPIPQKLVLPYNQNSLTFSFAGIYQRNPEAVLYKWKLKGLSNDWSPVLRQHEVTYSNLSPGKYTFEVIACNEYNVWSKDAATFEFVILSPIWKRWWFVTIIALLVIAAIWYYFQSRLEKSRIEKEKVEMEKNLIELEQEASRLQMNPHFIFNALNSIQGFITTNDAVQAKKYLTKFSRLMRLILENAREKYIPLQNEIEMLDNYLEFERLCKNNKFEYRITADPGIDTENLEIPPMMIQPFVENAILHGIKNKEGHGLVSISFGLKSSTLICEVTDDGIGRQKAAEVNAKYNVNHKSTAIHVTQKRLEQLQMISGQQAGFLIFDLNKDGSPAGTKVVISIPVEC
jgi:ligand-binding sensor domain-containing protein